MATHLTPPGLRQRFRGLFLGLLLLLASGLPGHSAETSQTKKQAQPTTPSIEEVMVIGRRPGPPLWRVTNGDNTLWIFATLNPIPKHLTWDEDSLVHIVNTASHFITPPDISASTSNPLQLFRVLRQLKSAERLPAGRKLEEVVEPALHLTLEEVRKAYGLRKASVAGLRPLAVANKLRKTAYKANGLQAAEPTTARLNKLVKRGNLQILDSGVTVAIADVEEIMRSVDSGDELLCLQSTLEHLAFDQWSAVDRARAWSIGDADQLLKFDYPEPDRICGSAIKSSTAGKQAAQRSQALWLTHARNALGAHRVTLTSLPIEEIVHPEGLLADLLEENYQLRGQGTERLDRGLPRQPSALSSAPLHP